MIGERVYLRMLTPDDGEIMRDASLTETETMHDPRFALSALELERDFARIRKPRCRPDHLCDRAAGER